MTDNPVAKVCRDLSEIQRLAGDLSAEAEHRANSRQMMGGDALANTAHVANLEAWRWKQDAAEDEYQRGGRAAFPETVHEDDADEPVLQALVFWSEDRRTAEGQELNGRRATLASEANFLRWAADAMWRDEPMFAAFVEDVAKARRKLENILSAGKRDETTRVRCANPECESKPLLRRIVTDDGLQSWWKCRACRTRYDAPTFADARRKQWAEAGDRFMSAVDAESLLRTEGVPDRLVRTWLSSEGLDEDDAYLEGDTRMVRWSALWSRHREREARLARDKQRRAERRGA